MTGSPEPDGSPRYWAWLYSPPRLRAVLEPLLALETEIRSVLKEGADHHIAHVRLEWWREECARCRAGAPAHPLTRSLSAACAEPDRSLQRPAPERSPGARSRPDLRGLIDTATWDLAAATFANRAELDGYCERWAAAMTAVAAGAAVPDGRLALEPRPDANGASLGPVVRFGHALGRALRELELLGDLRSDAGRGRLRLPLDELEREGVEPEELARPLWPPDLCRMLRERHRSARRALARAVAELRPSFQPPLRGLIVWAAIASARSARAERALPRPWVPSGPSRLAEVAIGWRAARRADRRTFRL